MGFSWQGFWSGLPFPSPGDLLDSGIEPGSPALQADSLLTELPGKPNFMAIVTIGSDFGAQEKKSVTASTFCIYIHIYEEV